MMFKRHIKMQRKFAVQKILSDDLHNFLNDKERTVPKMQGFLVTVLAFFFAGEAAPR